MKEFKSRISDAVLNDLKGRLKIIRWPDEITDSAWTYGADLSYMKELCHYWLHHFDWRKTEEKINALPNFIAKIDGHEVHFIYVKGRGKKTIPLIITHGWPGSFLEMMKVIPLLTQHPELSFDLVVPSMIGFGFSEKMIRPGGNAYLMAKLWTRLMRQLGYEKFFAQGGDFGAGVSTALGLRHPENLLGIHLNYIPGSYRPCRPPHSTFTDEEIDFQKSADDWFVREGSYAHQHRTKPLTLAYSMTDSPAGLCSWIIEKFHYWSDCKDNLDNVFTKDELLANVTLYWVTETFHSSIRLYNENSKVPFHFGENDFVHVPTGIAHLPKEEPFPPRSYIERGYNVTHWTDFPRGGHFAAMEQPALLADDIRAFTKKTLQ